MVHSQKSLQSYPTALVIILSLFPPALTKKALTEAPERPGAASAETCWDGYGNSGQKTMSRSIFASAGRLLPRYSSILW